jgi:hypothetical protein
VIEDDAAGVEVGRHRHVVGADRLPLDVPAPVAEVAEPSPAGSCADKANRARTGIGGSVGLEAPTQEDGQERRTLADPAGRRGEAARGRASANGERSAAGRDGCGAKGTELPTACPIRPSAGGAGGADGRPVGRHGTCNTVPYLSRKDLAEAVSSGAGREGWW